MLIISMVSYLIISRKIALKKSSRTLLSIWLLINAFGLGLITNEVHHIRYDQYHYQKHITDNDSDIIIQICSDPKINNAHKYEAEVLSINDKSVRGKLMLYIKFSDHQSSYKKGDIIYTKARIQRLRRNSNPNVFDYKAYLENRVIYYQIYTKQASTRLLRNNAQGFVLRTIDNIRNYSLSILRKHLKKEDHYAIASAMILGVRNSISKDLYTAYSETGSVHILAVSGLHVGIITMFFVFLLDRLRLNWKYYKTIKALMLIAIVWFYTILTGSAPAVTRAAIMFTLFLIGKYWYDQYNIYNIVAASALVLLIYDPNLLFQASFQFSFMALISIVFFHQMIFTPLATGNKIIDKISNLGVLSISAQMLVFPITIYYFHKLPVYFILSGIFAVFLAPFILGCGLLLILFSTLDPVASWLGILLDQLLYGFIWIINWIHDLPMSSINGIWMSTRTMIAIYIALGFLMIGLHKKRPFKMFASAASILILLLSIALYNMYNDGSKHMMTVYDTSYKISMIDIFNNQELISITSSSTKKSDIEFLAQNHRIKHGVYKDITPRKSNGIYPVKDQIVYIPSQNSSPHKMPRYSDILVITDQVNLKPSKLMNRHQTKLIILDNALYNSQRKRWTTYGKEHSIAVYDIKKAGAFVREF